MTDIRDAIALDQHGRACLELYCHDCKRWRLCHPRGVFPPAADHEPWFCAAHRDTIRIAVNSGEQTSFHSVVVWGRTAEVVCRYLKKGRLVEVTGRSQERTYQAEDGERRVTEIVAYQVQFLSRRTTSEPQPEGERAVA